MQVGIRKNTGYRGHGRLRKNESSRKFRQKIAFFALVFFASCATFQKPDTKGLKNNLDRICFSAEGKGRVTLSSKKYAFDFESLISRDKKKWAIDFHFPSAIEKIIEVNYDRPLPKQKETFKKLLADLNKEEFNYFLLSEFWEKMSKILKASEGLDKNLNWSILRDKFIISFPPAKGYTFRFEAFNLDLFFRRMKISIEKEGNSGINGPALQIELFLDSCSVI